MATSKKFSQLPAASAVGNGDLFAIAHEDALAETGYVSQKLTAAQAGQKVNGDTEYPTSLPSFPENGQNPFAALEKLNADIETLYPVNTASGSIANFTTSLVKPLTELTSTIVAQQASGTPTPSSPLPISGVSSVIFTQQDGESTTIDTFTIQLGQTVYGGSVDAKSGKLTLTYYIVDMGDLTYSISSGGLLGVSKDTIQTVTGYNPKRTATANVVCTVDVPTQTTNQIRFPNLTPSAEDAPTTYAGQKVMFELETPVEITGLTPDNFTTIAGENNIFSDCGEVSVGFKQSIQEYIDSKIAETQALIL